MPTQERINGIFYNSDPGGKWSNADTFPAPLDGREEGGGQGQPNPRDKIAFDSQDSLLHIELDTTGEKPAIRRRQTLPDGSRFDIASTKDNVTLSWSIPTKEPHYVTLHLDRFGEVIESIDRAETDLRLVLQQQQTDDGDTILPGVYDMGPWGVDYHKLSLEPPTKESILLGLGLPETTTLDDKTVKKADTAALVFDAAEAVGITFDQRADVLGSPVFTLDRGQLNLRLMDPTTFPSLPNILGITKTAVPNAPSPSPAV